MQLQAHIKQRDTVANSSYIRQGIPNGIHEN
jgi:hypothetical protein